MLVIRLRTAHVSILPASNEKGERGRGNRRRRVVGDGVDEAGNVRALFSVTEETEKRADAALSKLDWDKMSSHFQSKESAEAINNLRLEIRRSYILADSLSDLFWKDILSVRYDELYKEMVAKELLAKQKLFSPTRLILLSGLMFSLTGLYAWKKASYMKRNLETSSS